MLLLYYVFGTEPIVTDYTLRKIHVSKWLWYYVVTGRAHCQRQVAFFFLTIDLEWEEMGLFAWLVLLLELMHAEFCII